MTHLQWAAVEGKRVNVSRFASLPPAKRPPATCIACGEPVVMKLGSYVVHHVAHRPDSTCRVRSGESALHFNTKMYLQSELSKTERIIATAYCMAGRRSVTPCLNRISLWDGVQWNRAATELAVGNVRPDVVLLDGDLPVAAIEVHVSHAVSESKREKLRALQIPWIEVTPRNVFQIKSAWSSATVDWTASEPLWAGVASNAWCRKHDSDPRPVCARKVVHCTGAAAAAVFYRVLRRSTGEMIGGEIVVYERSGLPMLGGTLVFDATTRAEFRAGMASTWEHWKAQHAPLWSAANEPWMLLTDADKAEATRLGTSYVVHNKLGISRSQAHY